MGMLSRPCPQRGSQVGFQALRNHANSILSALRLPDDGPSTLEIKIVHPQTKRFHES